MKKHFLIIFFFTLVFSVSAQEQWSLERCINYALENNIQIKTQELNVELNNNQLQQSKLSLLPGLNAGASQNFTFGRSVDRYTNDFSTDNFSSSNFQVSSSLTLFSGMQKYNTIKKAEIDQRAGFLLLEQTKNNISLAIASAYLNVLYSMDLVDIAQQQLAITEQQLEQTIKLVDGGSLPEQNKYEISAQLANEELNIVNYENQLNLATLTLMQILELESGNPFSIIRPDITNIDTESALLSIDQIYSQAIQKMPEIEYAELNYLSSERNLAIAKSSFYPQLSMSASYGTGYSSAAKAMDQLNMGTPYLSGFATDNTGNILDVYQYSFDYTYATKPFSDQLKDNASTAIIFNLSIPIFNGWQAKTNVNNSKLYLEQTKLQVDQARKDLYKNIQQAHSDAQSALKQNLATQKTLQAMELSFSYTQKRYEQGLLNSTDYNVVKNNLTKTQTELIRAKYDYIFKLKILDFYRGISIKI
ncbi:MAG: TolC family protein [Bacteroidales bacterium]|nr:TolC family protein [Bacteroidales bacterium]MDD4217427.1 TolC family protein [Bacteroidales bacterium]MDY0141706.1 TolC family protein [Bacteroidales bacterium]